MENKGIKLEIKDAGGKTGVKLIVIDGELDAMTSVQLERVVEPIINKEKYLILDCSNLKYMNTAGLVLLLKCYTNMKRKNGDFIIVNPNKLIYEILDLAGMFNFFKVYNTQEEAISSIKENA